MNVNIKTYVFALLLTSSVLVGSATEQPKPFRRQFTTWGGSASDSYTNILATDDGGFVCLGTTTSTDTAITNAGMDDGVIVKYDSNRQLEWISGFGKQYIESVTKVIQDKEGGFVVAGKTASANSTAGTDGLIVKFDKNGNQELFKEFVGNNEDVFESIIQVKDGGYVAVGYSRSTNLNFTNKGSGDAIIVKFDDNWNQQWIKSISGRDKDCFYDVVETDNGVVVCGKSLSKDAGFQNLGGDAGVIVKYDMNGNQQWIKSTAGNVREWFKRIITTKDDGFMIVGSTNSNNLGVTNNGKEDALVIKYDKYGAQQWIKTWGGANNESFESIIEIDDEYFLTGYSYSDDAGFENNGYKQGVLVKLDKEGNLTLVDNIGLSSGGVTALNSITRQKNTLLLTGNTTIKDFGAHYGGTDALIVQYDEIKPPKQPTLNKTTDNKIELINNEDSAEFKELQYRVNGGEWITYTEPFEYIYNELGHCKIEVKAINIYDIESDVLMHELTEVKDEKDITMLFKQPHTLSVTLSSNSVDFGEITGVESVEKKDSIALIITSSSQYDVGIKATDDIVGASDSLNVIDISKLKVSTDTAAYQELSKSYKTLISNRPKGINAVYSLNFKLDSTLGVRRDLYSAPIKINIVQK